MLNIPNPDAYNATGTHNNQNNSGHAGQETKQDKLNRLLDTRNKIAEAMKTNITFSHPILKQNDKAVFYPKTINVIQGKAGVHKSRLAETICSALLSGPGNSKDLLGFKKDPLTRYVVVYVDTERNLSEQLPYALQQIKLKAGYQIEESITDFDWVSLLEFDRESRFEMLDIFLEYVREEYNIHIFIVLDVITDCVFNFNDTKDSMKLIDMMNKSINRFDVTFLCLIHENPGNTDKARGHLGTEILNKASTVIQISFEKDKDQHAMELIKISYLKCRNSKKHDPFYVQYAEEQKGLVIADTGTIKEAMDRKKFKADYEAIIEYLTEFLKEPAAKRDLHDSLKDALNCSERTLEDRLKEIIEEKRTVYNTEGIVCQLQKTIENRKVMYFLHPVISETPF